MAEETKKPECLVPDSVLLCKLGSICVHIDEGLSKGGHEFDIITIKDLLEQPDVKQWLKDMEDLALLPVKRS